MVEEYFDESVSEETVGRGGYDLVKPGYYQVKVADVREKEETLEIDFEVVGGTKADQVSQVHREFMTLNSKDMNRRRRLAFALACNLVTRDDVKAARENATGLSIDYLSAADQHCVIEIEHQVRQRLNNDTGNYEDDPSGKVVARIPFDNIWHIDDKSVARKGVKVDRSKINDDPFGGGPVTAAEAASDAGSDFS